MMKYTVPTLFSAGLLLLSLLIRVLLEWPPFVQYFIHFMWMHVAVVILGFYGFWVLHNARSSHVGGFWTFVRGFPLWLAALAVPVTFAIAPMRDLMPAAASLGTTPDGKPVGHKSWVQEGDRHFVVLNRTIKVEISAAQYIEEHRQGYALFSSAWIFFSYLMLVIWHYNRRREGLRSAG
jgi:hypothetical protein